MIGSLLRLVWAPVLVLVSMVAIVGSRPRRAGTVIRVVGETVAVVPPSFAETVAIPIVHNWGPVNEAHLVASLPEFEQLYGPDDTPGRTAVLGAFAGQGLPGSGGAGGVWVYRMATGAAVKATATVQNATPAGALRLDAKHEGVRGNDISFSIAADPRDAARDILTLRFRGVRVSEHPYARTDIDALVADINLRSTIVDATSLVTGVALAVTAGTSLAGGTDGTPITATEWLAATTALEFKRFSIFAPYDLTDAGVRASIISWLRSQEEANRPVMAVIGGVAGEGVADAITRSAAINYDHVVNVGVGTWHDDLLDKDLSTSQLAPRVAGILAARGEERSLTFAEVVGLSAVGDTGPDSLDIEDAVRGGVVVFSQTSNPDADLHIEEGVTTYTGGVADRPANVFGDPRLVRILDIYIRNMKEWGDRIVIGDLPVDDGTRALVRGEARRLANDLEARRLIMPGTSEVGTPIPDDPDLVDTLPYTFAWDFSRTARNIIGEGRVR